MRKLKQILFFSSILIFLVAFNFQDNPPSNWYQQFLPSIGSRQITDITFKDSLTGYTVATVASDTSYVLKTTNGGDNWQIVFRNFFATTQVQFLNKDTGYVCGSRIFKTTNGGINWISVNNGGISSQAMYVLNHDTIWIVLSESFTGGIFRTTNDGVNWTQQLSAGIYNPTNIYFYNRNLGFAANWQGGKLYRTTNAGENWTQVLNEGFFDIQFVDSLTGWKSTGSNDSCMKKTTDGGLTWFKQTLPVRSPQITSSNLIRFTAINKDTLIGVGNYYHWGNKTTGFLYKTTNGGTNWGYQLIDSAINIYAYIYVDFTDKNHGWAYGVDKGIHTLNGGDTTFYVGVQQISSSVPNNYKLNQNFPNPFNPVTNNRYSIIKSGFVILKVFNIQGKEVANLVNQNQTAGEYQYSFEASSLSSGVYFYTLEINNSKEKFIDTKKMILIK